MPVVRIAGDATILSLTGKPAQREEYVRRLLANFYKLGSARTDSVVRIGAQGKGHSPHYRFEAAAPALLNDQPVVSSRETRAVYNGLNHKEMTAFEIADMKDENWSDGIMTFSEVETHFGDLRARPRRI